MKSNFCLVLVILMLAPKIAASQYTSAPLPPNYPIANQLGATLQQIVDTMYQHANAADTGEGGELEQIAQFVKFWQGRVSANDNSGTNMFNRYFTAMKSAAAAKLTSGSGAPAPQGKWVNMGSDDPDAQTSGYVNAVWADPNDSNYILAATQGGLFKTTDAGAHWHCITDHTVLAGASINVLSIAVNPLNSNTILIGTIGVGMLKTFDGGNTWHQENVFFDGQNVRKIYYTPDSLRIYTLNTDWGNVFTVFTRMSADGSSWTNVAPAGDTVSYNNLQFLPGDRNHLFVSSTGRYSGIWETTDSLGATGWNKITANFSATVSGIYTSPTGWRGMNISLPGNDTLYFVAMDSLSCNAPPYICPQTGLFKYNISGTTHSFAMIYDNLPFLINPDPDKLQLIVSPSNPNNIYYANDIPSQAFDRINGFIATGTYYSAPTHGDIRGIFLQQSSGASHGVGDRLYLADDGGVSIKPTGVDVFVDSAHTTRDISGRGLLCGTYWSFAVGEGDVALGGMMHDGVISYQPSLAQQWKSLIISDAWGSEVDRSHPGKGYAWAESAVLDSTNSTGSRQMAWLGTFPQPNASVDPGFDGVGKLIGSDNYGNVYCVGKYFWRKKQFDGSFEEPIYIGFPSSTDGLNFIGAQMAYNPSDTTYDGYVLYNASANIQHIYYRKATHPFYYTASEISTSVPGTFSNFDSSILSFNMAYPLTSIATNRYNTD